MKHNFALRHMSNRLNTAGAFAFLVPCRDGLGLCVRLSCRVWVGVPAESYQRPIIKIV